MFIEWCFECGESGHIKKDFPKINWGNTRKQPPTDQPRPSAPVNRRQLPAARTNQQARNSKKPQAGGRVFFLEAEEGGEDPHTVVLGMFPVNALPTKV